MTLVRCEFRPGRSLAVNSPPLIVNTSLPNGTQGQPYSAQLTAVNGVPPYSWSLTSQSDPAFSIDPNTGILSGTTFNVGLVSVNIKVTDSLSTPTAPTNFTFTISSGTLAGAPQGIFGSVVQTNSVAMGWWPTPADTGANGTTYNIYQNGIKVQSGITPFPGSTARVPGLLYVANTLSPLTTYNFQVSGTDNLGNETALTPVLSATTLSAAAGAGATLPTPALNPDTWLPPTNGFTIPLTGTIWTATNTTTPLAVGTGPKQNVGCGLQFALNSAALGDVIVVTAGATYTSTAGTATFTYPILSGPGTLYIVSSQTPEYQPGGTLPACSYQGAMYAEQVANITASVPYAGQSATLTAAWTGRTGWYPTTFYPVNTISNQAFVTTAAPLLGATGATLASVNGVAGGWPYQTGYCLVKCASGNDRQRLGFFTHGSTAITWVCPIRSNTTPAGNDGMTSTSFTLNGMVPEVHPVLYTNGSTAISWTSGILCNGTGTQIQIVPGNYVSPADIPSMAVIQFSQTNSGTAISVPAASQNIRMIGVWLQPQPSHNTGDFGQVISLPFQQHSSSPPVTLANNITFDRCIIGNDTPVTLGPTGAATLASTVSGITHGAFGSCNQIAFHQCYFWGIGALGTKESHCTLALGGVGWCAQNCYLEAAGISIFHGGAFIPQNQMPQDTVYRYNYSLKPDHWRLIHAGDWMKNHFEWKCVQRAQLYGNWMVNGWYGGSGQQNGRATGFLARDQNAAQTLTVPQLTQISPWISVTDIDIHDNVMVNCGQAASFGTSDASTTCYTSRVRLANNIYNGFPGVGGSVSQFPANGWGIEDLGPTPDVTIDHNTFILNPATLANSATSSRFGVGGAWAWFNNAPVNLKPYTPNPMDNLSVRWTITNNIFDGTQAIGGDINPGFMSHIDLTTLNISNNVMILDAHAYPGTNNHPAVGYANIGFTNFVNNVQAPLHPTDWNVTTGTYATASTSGGPVGAIFGGPKITTGAVLPAATVGVQYTQALAASGGTPPYTYNWVSMAPNSGMWINVTPNGVITGTPQYNETTTLVVQINDSAGKSSQSTFTLASAATGALSVVTSTVPNATAGGMFVYQLLAQGGVPPYHWTTTMGTPYTCQDDGALTATPTTTGSASGIFTVKDSVGSTASTGTITATIDNLLRFNFYDFVDGQVRFPAGYASMLYGDFATRLSAAGGTPPYTYALNTGSLNGLTIASNGNLSGTPTSAGALSGSIKVTDSSGGGLPTVANFLLNVFSSGQVSRPAYNSATANGFFVLGGKLYDPSGFPATLRGFNRAHYAASAPGPQNFLGMNALHPNTYRLFTFNAASGGSTPAIIENDCNAVGIAYDELPIPVVSIIPGTNTAITGNSTPTNLGLAVNYWVANFSTFSPIQNKLVLNVANEFECTSDPNIQFQYNYQQVSCPITSVSGTTVTLNSSAATNPFANAASIGQVYIKGSTATNGIFACATATGGVSGAWTVTLSSSAGTGSGGTLYGGSVGILRAAGYTCPIMIDAGQDSPGTPYNIINYSAAIQSSDPLQNCIFSQHAYNYTTPFQNQIKSVATSGVNTVLTLNNIGAAHPFQQLATFFPEIAITVQGAAGSGWTSMNGTWAINHGANFGGSSGNWTITIPFNSSSLTAANYTTNSGVAFDFANPQITAAQFAALRSSNVCVVYGEFGPYGSAGNPSTYLRPTDVVQAAEANQLGWIAWAWDDGFVGFALVNNGTAGFYQHVSDITAVYGQDLVMHPRMSPTVLSIAAPVFGV